MKILSYNQLEEMNDNDLVSVSKDAIHIQIIYYESNEIQFSNKQEELKILITILSELLKQERIAHRQIQCAKMRVSDIRKCFTKTHNFPNSSFIQY